MGNRFPIAYTVVCECGSCRPHNEDCALVLPEEGVYVVADGMGGAQAGEEASLMTCQMLQEAMRGTHLASPGKRKFVFDRTLQQINASIQTYRLEHRLKAMGSTVVGLLFDPWEPWRADVVHCGDSRCYCLRKSTLKQLTEDHSLANERKRRGLTPGPTNILTNYLGADERMCATWDSVPVCPRDRFLLCSDGVSGMVSDDRLQGILCSGVALSECSEWLQEAVLEAGAQDNFTFVLVDIPEVLPVTANPTPEEIQESQRLYFGQP